LLGEVGSHRQGSGDGRRFSHTGADGHQVLPGTYRFRVPGTGTQLAREMFVAAGVLVEKNILRGSIAAGYRGGRIRGKGRSEAPPSYRGATHPVHCGPS